jgi:hypothetical protein
MAAAGEGERGVVRGVSMARAPFDRLRETREGQPELVEGGSG